MTGRHDITIFTKLLHDAFKVKEKLKKYTFFISMYNQKKHKRITHNRWLTFAVFEQFKRTKQLFACQICFERKLSAQWVNYHTNSLHRELSAWIIYHNINSKLTESHINTALCVIRLGLRASGDAVVTITCECIIVRYCLFYSNIC